MALSNANISPSAIGETNVLAQDGETQVQHQPPSIASSSLADTSAQDQELISPTGDLAISTGVVSPEALPCQSDELSTSENAMPRPSSPDRQHGSHPNEQQELGSHGATMATPSDTLSAASEDAEPPVLWEDEAPLHASSLPIVSPEESDATRIPSEASPHVFPSPNVDTAGPRATQASEGLPSIGHLSLTSPSVADQEQ